MLEFNTNQFARWKCLGNRQPSLHALTLSCAPEGNNSKEIIDFSFATQLLHSMYGQPSTPLQLITLNDVSL